MITLSDQKRLVDRSSFDAILRDEYDGDIEAFLDNLDEGMNFLLRKDLSDAEIFASEAQRFVKLLPRQYEARIISLNARYRLWIGDFEAALKIYSRALELFQRYRNYEAAARLRKGLIEVNMYLGRYKQAIETGRKAIRFFRSKRLIVDLAQSLTNVGNVYHRMDKNRLALQYYDKARKVFAKDGGIPLAIVDYNRANVYTNLGNLGKAKSLYLASADIYSDARMEIAECQARYAVAYILFLETRYSEALTEFEDVLDTFLELGDKRAAALSRLDMAEINIQLNQMGSAILLGEGAASEFRDFGMRYEEGKSHYFVAIAKLELGDQRHAAERLRKAEKLFLREGNALWIGMVKHARAKLLQKRNRHKSALRISEEAERHFSKAGDVRRKIDTQITRLCSFAASGRSSDFSFLAGKLKKARMAEYQRYGLQNALGDFYFGQSQFRRALSHYQSSIDAVEKMISSLFPDEVRLLFAADKYSCYLNAMECLLRLDRVEDAFHSSLRGLSLINESPATRANVAGKVSEELLDTIDGLRATLHRMESLPKAEIRSAVDSPSLAKIENRLWYYERKARTQLYRERSRNTERIRTTQPEGLNVPRDTTLISFVARNHKIGAFIHRSGETMFIDLNSSASELHASIRKLTFVFESTVKYRRSSNTVSETAAAYLQQIHEMLFEPLEPHIDGDQLVLLTEGDLNQIPFTALRGRRGQYLKDSYQISHAVKPEDLRVETSSGFGFTTTRNAIFGVTSDTLPFVDAECREVKQTFPNSTLFYEGTATRGELARQLRDVDGFLHIATHASRSCENPLFSRMLLEDGPFFPFDLFGSRLDANLVTISGCQTAAPGLYYGNSFSLAKAFYQAGARHVLATLWTVTDEITMTFMREFYRNLRDSDDVPASYRHAVNEIEKATRNPAYWGAFVMLGTK